MATLALAAVGSAVGASLLPAGVAVLGATITGATIGAQIGAFAGSYVDQALFGTSGQDRSYEGPRLGDLQVMASTEGAPIPRIYGRARIGGQVIWATDFEEVATTEEVGGGKGSVGGASQTTTTYTYFANFAVAIAEGEISSLGSIWADGEELDLSGITYRVYTGSDTQAADSLIISKEGASNAPAYRGVAYVVFERLPLADFGNRVPQLSFEVFRAVDDLHERIRGAAIIPGSGEFVYATEAVTRNGEGGARIPENVNTLLAETNWTAAIDQLNATLPNARSASLIVSWFGTDLRAAACDIRPGVEETEKDTRPLEWTVAGLSREQALLVSRKDGRPAYGGTPSDQSVITAIQDLKARGMSVVLSPFILMDIPDDNALPDPYTGQPSQPVYPWRGRITIDPAPDQPGTPDQTTAAADQIEAFVGTAEIADFSVDGQEVRYSGPDVWSFRRFVLHYAYLALAAGGVDAFVIGTELRGLTSVRDSAEHFPFVDALVALAVDLKSVLGSNTKITYAADWSEYFGYQPADGSNDVYFHLDPLWASDAIDAVGIDLYWPLSDWRDGSDHLDTAVARSVYDIGYLQSNINGGEGFDWYYASAADRDDQIRTPITDGQGEPWVFRYKDIKSWWINDHYDRPAGIRSSNKTAWVPESKPVWLMEVGCPALNKGANQPNVFYDPKSSESALPYYALARRDDLMQRRYLQALIEGFDPDISDDAGERNPISQLYDGRMIDLDRLHLYTWDARPFPAFPADADTWGDAPNWRFGHWLNGRLANLPLDEVVSQILLDFGFAQFDTSELEGVVPGYVINRIMSAREALQQLELAYFFDTIETGAQIRMRHRGTDAAVIELTPDQLVEARSGDSLMNLARAQETDLPAVAKIQHFTASGDYRRTVSEARMLSGGSERVASAELALMLEPDQGRAIAESWLHEAWASRDKAAFILPPSQMAVEPGDLVSSAVGDIDREYRIIAVSDHGAREIEAQSIDPTVYALGAAPDRSPTLSSAPVVGQANAQFLDLPFLIGNESENAGYIAISQAPWPGDVAIYSSPDESGYAVAAVAPVPATVGTTLSALPPGPEGRFDYATKLSVKLDGGTLTSASLLSLLSGANTAAVRNRNDQWEVLQFATVSLLDILTYELSGLLRGQAGTEGALVPDCVEPGAPFVLVNRAVTKIDLAADQVLLPLNWRYGPTGRDIGHASFAQTTHAFAGIGRRPLSPVHVRGSRQYDDLTIFWIRRTRSGGDSWDIEEIPFGEEFERYEVDILDGSTVVRTLTSSDTSALYSRDDQIADFGSAQAGIRCAVYQLSQIWGRGAGRIAIV